MGLTIERGKISIHAPREGSDARENAEIGKVKAISIHAPREGSDRTSQRACAILRYFYPRSP